MAKVVQTSLQDEEYKTSRVLLRKRRLSMEEGLHLAVTPTVKGEMRVAFHGLVKSRRKPN